MKHLLLQQFLVILLFFTLTPLAQAQCNFTAAVSPAGPLTLPPGGTHTLTSTISTGGFNFSGSGFNSLVTVTAQQTDGKLLVGGNFTTYNGIDCPHGLVRLTADGVLDPTFNVVARGVTAGFTGFNNVVYSLAVQPDGKILVGGIIVEYNGNASCPNGLARLNADGSLDATFNGGGFGFVGVNASASAYVMSLALQPDGKIVAAGNFYFYNTDANNFGLECNNHLCRLNANGSLDASFNAGVPANIAGFTGTIQAVVLQPDSKLLVGGRTASYHNQRVPDGVVRLLPSGALDATFNPGGSGFNGDVQALALQPDGKVVVGGTFTTFNGTTSPAQLARLTATGSLDTGFLVGTGVPPTQAPNYGVMSLALQPDGKILAGGSFTIYNGNAAAPDDLIRLNPDGTLDPAFNAGGAGFNDTPYIPSFVRTVAVQGSQALVGGQLGQYNGGVTPNGLVRINANGSLDNQPGPLTTPATYRWSPSGQTTASISVTQPGTYSVAVTANGCTTQSNAVFVTPPGNCAVAVVVDPAGPIVLPPGGQLLTATALQQPFNQGGAGFDAGVSAILRQPDGSVLVGGSFHSYNGQPRSAYLVRLLADGSFDSTFNPSGSGFDFGVTGLALQPDGKILVGGLFTTYNGSNCPDGLVRLNSNGSLDASFNPGGRGFGSSVGSGGVASAMVVQPDGKLVVGGGFTSYNTIDCPDNLLRLNPDGSVDATFGATTGFNGSVYTIVRLSSGQLAVGGAFSAYNGASCSQRLARLSAAGALDASYNSGTGTRGFNGDVYALLADPNGTMLVGGNFTTYNGVNCPDALVRVSASGSLAGFNTGGFGFQVGSSVGYVSALARQPDGQVLVGGSLGVYNGLPINGGVARLSASGVVDGLFNGTNRGGFNSAVAALDLAGDGTILAGGTFQSYTSDTQAQPVGRIARLLSNGTLNNQGSVLTEGVSYRWSPGLETTRGLYVTQPGTYTVTVTVGGCPATSNTVVVGGTATQLPATGCGFLAQASPAGPLLLPPGGSQLLTATAYRPGFNANGSGFNASVAAAVVQPDGKLVVAGSFTQYNGLDCPDFLVRLNPDGSLDPTFNPAGRGVGAPNEQTFGVWALALQPDGKILAGGIFSQYNGLNCSKSLIRLNTDGSIDPTFNPGGAGFSAARGVWALALRSDGRLLAGGGFSDYNGTPCANSLIQLTSSGLLDGSFNIGGTGLAIGTGLTCSGGGWWLVNSLALQPDGKVIVAGKFTTWNGLAVPKCLMRMNTDGTRDQTFNAGGAGFTCAVSHLLVQADGKILVGDTYGIYNGVATSNDLLRLLPNGTPDATFNSALTSSGVLLRSGLRGLVEQADGKIVLSVVFASLNGQRIPSILRIAAGGAHDPTFNAGGTGVATFNVGELAQQADGKILVAAYAPTTYNGLTMPDYFFRLSANGQPNLADEPISTGMAYAWSPGGQTGATLSVSQPGTYVATATLNGCATTTNTVLVVSSLPPVLTTLTPSSGLIGSVITLTGTNLSGTTVLTLNGQPVPGFVVNASGTSITFTVPAGATSGPVAVTTPGGTASSSTSFIVTAPQLALFVGSVPYASGARYSFGAQATGSTSAPVGFTLTNAGTAPLSLSSVRASGDFTLSGAVPVSVPAGGSAAVGVDFAPTALGVRSGQLEIISALGTYVLVLDGTGISPTPGIGGFSPTAGPVGTQVTLTGTNFPAAGTTVTFSGGVAAQSVQVSNGGTTLIFLVPAGAVAGPITVSTAGGTAASAASFCVHYAATALGVSRCGAGSVTLTGAGLSVPGAYLWYPQATGGQPLPGSGPNGATFVTPSLSQSTTYYLAISTGSGSSACEGPRQPVTVTLDPGPTVALTPGSSLNLCPGDRLTLTASGAPTYRWSTGATTASITVTAAGTYSVTGTNAAGCEGPAVAATVVASPAPPQPSISTAPITGGMVLTSSAPTGNQWYLNGQPVAGATGATLTVSSAVQQGTYTVVVTSTAGCSSLPSLGQAVVLAVAPAATSLVQLYPNPAHTSVHIQLPGMPGVDKASLALRDALGRVVRMQTVTVPASGLQYELAVNGLPSGVYLLHIQAGTFAVTRRLAVE